jgi:hypothetical protein
MRIPKRITQPSLVEGTIRANERAAMLQQIVEAIRARSHEVFLVLDSGTHKHYGLTELGSIDPDLATYQAALDEAEMIADRQR